MEELKYELRKLGLKVCPICERISKGKFESLCVACASVLRESNLPRCKTCNIELSGYRNKWCTPCYKKHMDFLTKNNLWNVEQQRPKIRCTDCNTELNHYGKQRRCKKCANKYYRGKNHHSWNPKLTDEERLHLRRPGDFEIWSRSIKELFDFTCEVCKDSTGNNLNSHHLNNWKDYPEQRYDLNNGVCLCFTCHNKFHKECGKRHNNKEQYIKFKQRQNGVTE